MSATETLKALSTVLARFQSCRKAPNLSSRLPGRVGSSRGEESRHLSPKVTSQIWTVPVLTSPEMTALPS